jgi:hypothetical protein
MHSDTLPAQAGARTSARERNGLALVFLLAVVLWTAIYLHAAPTVRNPDAQDYAQIARNVQQGKGFRTDVMPLAGLEWMRQTGRLGQPWWNVHRFPLPSVVEAGLFKVLGPTDFAAALFSALFFFAAIPLVFVFTRRLFPYRTAVVATILFVLAGGPMQEAITGLTEPAATFFFLAALYLVLWPKNRWSFALAGLITGFAFLNRSSVFLYGIPMLFLIPRSKFREQSSGTRVPGSGPQAPALSLRNPVLDVLAFCIPGVLVTLPWLVRNFVLTGDPMFSLTSALMVRYLTPVSPHTHDWYQFVYEKPSVFIKAHPAMILHKWLGQVGTLWYNDWVAIGDAQSLVPLFLVGLLRPYQGVAAMLRRWLFWVFIFHFAVLALLVNIPRYYAIFAPILFIYVADMVVWIWDTLRPKASNRATLLAGVMAASMVLGWMHILGPVRRTKDARVRYEDHPSYQAWIKANTAPDAFIVSDVPWSVAWLAERRSVPIPPTPAEMGRFRDYGLTPDGVYLKCPQYMMDLPEGWDDWHAVQLGFVPLPGYRRVRAFPDQSVYFERIRSASVAGAYPRWIFGKKRMKPSGASEAYRQ